MKLLTTAVVLIPLLLSGNSEAKDVKYVAGDDSIESEMCVSAATDSVNKFRRTVTLNLPMRSPIASMRLISNKLNCNGDNIETFAQLTQNDAVAQYLGRFKKGNVKIYDIARVNPNINLSGSVVISTD